MSQRYLPTLTQVRDASRKLPDPNKWSNAVYVVPLGHSSDAPKLEFRRIKLSNSSEKSHRWVFEGKILIRSSDQAADDPDPIETGEYTRDSGFFGSLFG